MSDYYRYGIANTLNRIIDGADTLKEAREIVDYLRKEDNLYNIKSEYHIYLLDDNGHIKTWNDRLEV